MSIDFETKLTRIIKSTNLDIRLIEVFKKNLSGTTKKKISDGNLKLWIYSQIFFEALESDDIDKTVSQKLDDPNYITQKIAEYKRLFR